MLHIDRIPDSWVRNISFVAWTCLRYTVEFEIGFSSRTLNDFIFDPQFMRTSPLWLVSPKPLHSLISPAAREANFLPRNVSCRPSALFPAVSRDSVDIMLHQILSTPKLTLKAAEFMVATRLLGKFRRPHEEEIYQRVDWGETAVFTDRTSKYLCCGIGQANYKLDRQTLESNWGLPDLNCF
jgi:hypothetical protein